MHTAFSARATPKQKTVKAPAVRIKRKVKLNGKWTFATIARKGDRYQWDHVLVDGTPQKVEGGSFFLEWVEAGRKIQRSLSTIDSVEALSAKESQESLLKLQSQGHAADVEVISRGITLKEHFDRYLDDRRHALGWRSLLKYRKDLDRFLELTSKRYVNQITREDIIGHVNKLRDGGMSAQTSKTDAGVVLSAIRAAGAEIKMKRGDWPKVVKHEVEIFTMEDLKDIFDAADPYEFAVYQTLLKTGFREQEGMFLAWPNVNWKRATISVTAKPEYNFKPKNGHERVVPVPTSLLDVLESWRSKSGERSGSKHLVFPTKEHGERIGGGADSKLLEKLKRRAHKAGLNCGRCTGSFQGKPASCAVAPVCRYWFLHKFRATAITEWLRSGIDIRTVQALAGHETINSTIKYLRPLEGQRLNVLVNGSSLANI
jgi:integrase